MKRLFGLVLLLWAVPHPAQEPVSGIVQVAINYGPKQDGYFSGVVVGDGRIVLTDALVVTRAREAAIAFSDGEILETVMAQIQSFNHIAVLPMTGHHGQVVSVAPLARETSPSEDVEAVAGGAPKAFQVDRRVVHLHPVGSGGALRWQITPLVPPQYRGGPLLTSQGQLIAVIVQEGDKLIGMPLGEMLAMVDAAAGPSAAPPTPAVIKPSETEIKREPAVPDAPKPVAAAPLPSRQRTPAAPSAPPVEAPAETKKAESTEPPRATPPAESLSSVFKDSAIAPVRIEAPVVPKPAAPSKASSPSSLPAARVAAARVSRWNMRLTPIRTAWAWNTDVRAPIPSLNMRLSVIRTTWLWSGDVRPPIPALNASLPRVRAAWIWSGNVRPPIPVLNVKLPPIRTAWAWPRALPPPAVAPPVQLAAAAPAKPAPKSAPKPEKDKSKKAAAEQAQPAPSAPAPATEAGSRELDTFLQQAADYMQSKDYPKAVDTLEEALRQHPDEAKLYFQLALAYWYKALQKPDGSRRTTMEKTSYHKAVKAFQTFLERAPNDPLANEARMRLAVLRNAQYGGGM